MEIKYSRHAKRRMKLYKIPESTIYDILTGMNLNPGEHEITKDVTGFKYPLKVVISVAKDKVTIITSYPLKKGRKR